MRSSTRSTALMCWNALGTWTPRKWPNGGRDRIKIGKVECDDTTWNGLDVGAADS